MDQRRFDAALRVLHVETTRRSGVAAWLAALLGAAVTGIGEAAPARGERGERRRGPGAEGPCGNGSRKDNACTKNRDCCTGVCDTSVDQRNKDGKGRCRCLRNGTACKADRNCCSGLTCTGGVCARRRPTPPVCDATTCPNGCCAGSTCVASTDATCGIGGVACVACGPARPYCAAGACANGTWTPFALVPVTSGISTTALSADGLELYATNTLTSQVEFGTLEIATGDWTARYLLGDQGSANNQFGGPFGLVLSADGLTLYVADQYNHRIDVWTRGSMGGTWAAQTPLGGSGSADNQFSLPQGVALSADGLELYVGDTGNNRVARWTRTSTSAPWTAQPPLGGTQGSANDQFALPMGLAISVDGTELYVADYMNSRIAVWTRTGPGAPWTAQAPLGSSGSGYDQFGLPTGVALAADEMALYVADYALSRVAVWTRADRSAPWTALAPLGNGTGAAADQFDQPYGLSLSPDGTALYIADFANARIAEWRQNP